MYKDFMTGLDGSPMPSFSDNVKPDEAWELVMYLRTLQPDNTPEKQIAKQLGLTPIDPSQPLPDTSSPSDSGQPAPNAPANQPAQPSNPAPAPSTNPPSPPQSNNSGNQ